MPRQNWSEEVAAGAMPLDLTVNPYIAGDVQYPAEWVEMPGGGTLTYLDGSGTTQTITNAEAGHVAREKIRKLVSLTGASPALVRIGQGLAGPTVAPLAGGQGPQGIQGIQGVKGDKGDTGNPGAPGTSIPVRGTVTSAGGDTTTIAVDPGAVGIAGVSIIVDPDGRDAFVVRVDFADRPGSPSGTHMFPDVNYVFTCTAYSVTGSAYTTYSGFPTTAGRQTDHCIFRLAGGSDGNPSHDPLSCMILAM